MKSLSTRNENVYFSSIFFRISVYAHLQLGMCDEAVKDLSFFTSTSPFGLNVAERIVYRKDD